MSTLPDPTDEDDEPIVLEPNEREYIFDPTADDAALLAQVLTLYQKRIHHDERAQAFLRDHGFSKPGFTERFHLGFSDRTLGRCLPSKQVKAGRAIRERLTALGILSETGKEPFHGSLIVPMFDKGKIIQFYGRKIGTVSATTELDTWLPRPRPALFNAAGITDEGQAIICTSPLDALVLLAAGMEHSCAITTEDSAAVVAALREHEAEYLWLAHPRTPTGEAAAKAMAALVEPHGMSCLRVRWPFGLDAAAYARRARSPDALPALVRDAEEMDLDDGDSDEDDEDEPPNDLSESSQVRKGLVITEDQRPQIEPAAPTTICTSPEESPVAEPSTPSPVPIPKAQVIGEDVHLTLGDRAYRVRGLAKNTGFESMRVTIRVVCGDACHVDSVDLYNARARTAFTNAAADEFGLKPEVVKKDLGKLILACEQVQDERIRSLAQPTDTTPRMTPQDEGDALALLRDPKLADRIISDFDRCGIIGEEMNKLLGYFASVSRKLDNPLAVVIQSSSAAGKTSLMDAILAFVPEEDLVQFSSMTGQSLYYLPEDGLRHRVLAIAEEAGMERASYALKLLQSEGELRIASTGKDSSTGRMVTQTYTVSGPVAIFLTTTAIDIDEELLNRCIVLTVSEDRAQTRAVHAAQRARQTLAGRLAGGKRNGLLKLHRNAQRLLQPLVVVNPYADRLTFPDDRTRTRRDHAKYLVLIQSVTLLFQHQRERKQVVHDSQTIDYIEVTIDDLALANRLAHHALGRSLDELPPQTRRLLTLITEMVAERCKAQAIDRSDLHFTRRDAREFTHWGLTQLKIHLDRLEELEYLIAHAGDRGRSYVYELAHVGTGQDGVTLPGLIDVAQLRGELTAPRGGVDGGMTGAGRQVEKAENAGEKLVKAGSSRPPASTHGRGISPPSNRTHRPYSQGGAP